MKISIIIPTYNEAQDISKTLDALIDLKYIDKEILVVDDSTDTTPAIVEGFAHKGVRLIHPGGGGRCEARNLGIELAKGEIICILNADVRPRPDFLQRISSHYLNGADYVLVGAKISNQQDLFARYIDCAAESWLSKVTDDTQVEWTEGFSCRKAVALKTNLFPTGFVEPLTAGEDGYFGESLRCSGANKVVDFSIVVDHIAPATLKEYWYIRKGRGYGSVQVHRFLEQWSYAKIIAWNIIKIGRTILYTLTLIPSFAICWQAARYSEKKMLDLFPFWYAWIIEQLAFHTGEWQAVYRTYMKEKHRATYGG